MGKVNKILILVIGMIIGTSITVCAYSYHAKDIEFTPTNENWKVDNVEDAINELFNKKTNLDGTDVYHNDAYSNTRYKSNPVTLELPKGTFICNTVYVASSDNSNKSLHEESVTTHSYQISGCEEMNIIKDTFKTQFANAYHNGSLYNGFVKGNINFICENDDISTITVDYIINGITSNNYISTGREITCNRIS